MQQISGFFRRLAGRFIQKRLQIHWAAFDKTLPKHELAQRHLANLTALPNRQALLERLPKNAVVAEIGVAGGTFSEQIWTITRPSKLHLIDMWGSTRYHDGLRQQVETRFAAEIESGRVVIHHASSIEAAHQFPNGYFDWIYIDTDHSYQTTKDELNFYSSKISLSGIIAGHDFIKGNWNDTVRYGVIEAVYEFCVENNWELVYLTMENNTHPSFAMRRIS